LLTVPSARRRCLPVLLVLLAAALALASPSFAADGPRIAFVEWLAEPPMTRLTSVGVDGSARTTLALDGVQPVPFEGPVWSPDGSALVFSGYPVAPDGGLREGARFRIFVIDAAGGEPREVPGSLGGSHPVLSPDGRTVAFQRSKFAHRFDPANPLDFGSYFSVTTWTVSLEGGRPRQLTPWRNQLVNAPAAFSPDGSTLLLERDRAPGGRQPEVVARNLSGGPLRVIARGAEDPSYSPDGSSIALISYRDGLRLETGDGPAPVGEVYVVRADGSQPRRLTKTPRAQESQPSWSPSGGRIAFVRTPGPGGFGFGSTLFQVNADGACQRRVAGSSSRSAPALYGPAWQPGPGREAGPLSC
jgi:dipeptidyl aminopeptidase/acylaminoacyl peptidase